MQVGDLVVQLGWESTDVGVVTKVWNAGDRRDLAKVHWLDGVVDMYRNQLRVISESR